MNAFRKTRTLVLLSVLSLVIAAVAATSAQANGSCHSSPSYCNYGSYCSSSYCYPSYCNYTPCNYTTCNYPCFTPASYCQPQQYCFPVTVYDCYGRPSIVWQTSYGQAGYGTLPVKFAQ